MFLIYTKNIECVWKKVDTKKICLKKMLIMYLKKNVKHVYKNYSWCIQKIYNGCEKLDHVFKMR